MDVDGRVRWYVSTVYVAMSEVMTSCGIGHLGESTVEHVAHHLPATIRKVLERDRAHIRSAKIDPGRVASLLKQAFAEFDSAIAGDELDLFPGGLAGLERLSGAQIQRVINDHDNGLENCRKMQRIMCGTTALVALVDPAQEHLWIASLSNCQAGMWQTRFVARFDTELKP